MPQTTTPESSIAIISHPECLLHDMGPDHPERPARISTIEQAIKSYHFKLPVQSQVTFHLAPLATTTQLNYVHSKNYIDWIFAIAPKKDFVQIDADTIMNSHTLTAALHAAGAVVLAVDLVLQKQEKTKVAFCNIRPPGHHAERDCAMGFCFFNNVAIGCEYAMHQYGIKRIAIIDFDVHHGNGTQDIFQNQPHILYCSSFEYPFYPGYNPRKDNEHLLAVPLAAGTDGLHFREAVAKKWFHALSEFQPELVFFSAGFDAHVNDPLANLKLTKEDYVWLTENVLLLTKASCKGRMISVLEGGYDLHALAECVPAHIDAMIDASDS